MLERREEAGCAAGVAAADRRSRSVLAKHVRRRRLAACGRATCGPVPTLPIHHRDRAIVGARVAAIRRVRQEQVRGPTAGVTAACAARSAAVIPDRPVGAHGRLVRGHPAPVHIDRPRAVLRHVRGDSADERLARNNDRLVRGLERGAEALCYNRFAAPITSRPCSASLCERLSGHSCRFAGALFRGL